MQSIKTSKIPMKVYLKIFFCDFLTWNGNYSNFSLPVSGTWFIFQFQTTAMIISSRHWCCIIFVCGFSKFIYKLQLEITKWIRDDENFAKSYFRHYTSKSFVIFTKILGKYAQSLVFRKSQDTSNFYNCLPLFSVTEVVKIKNVQALVLRDFQVKKIFTSIKMKSN